MYFSDDSLLSKIRLPFIIKNSRRALVSLILSLCVLACGCAARYYKVSDPATEKTYYTDDLKKIQNDGVELRDARTGETVTIQNSEVKEINKYEFDTARLQSGTTTTEKTQPAPSRQNAL